MVCEGGDDIDGEMGEEMEVDEQGIPQPKKKSHGGCGHRQPIFRKEGLGLSVNFKANANDVSIVASFVLTMIAMSDCWSILLTGLPTTILILAHHSPYVDHRTLNPRASAH